MTENETTPAPTPDEARALLARSAAAAGTLRASGQNRHALWLTGHAASTFMFFVGLSTIPDDTGALTLAGAYGLTLLVLSLAWLRGAPVTKQGMGLRWVAAVTTWGVVYAIALVVGLTWLRESVLWWLAAAVLATFPLARGAWREAQA
ncbi:hypothetical protein ACFO3K_11385 [Cellulomonas algicola]|uniref:Uncharacterized protein n=1 Tax=Cellulomonas algicola TaxID=2071633 RepID=A0A401UXW0_9CELL|nr:hypothetical protein [Cellulomonas algicola]GCD19464.1 hypothetical protein CTKZ_10260 [Cellulomonas algicola]